jgi:iron complex transport system substrate-binding protein
MIRLAPALVAASLTLSACNNASAARAENGSLALPTPPPEGLRWARTAHWELDSAGIRLTVLEPWKGAREPLKYLLAGAADSASVGIIRVPARRVAVLGAVHAGFLVELGARDRIIAVDARRHVHDSALRALTLAGKVAETGSGAALNVERLLAARPDLVLANAVTASENEALDRLRRVGIPVVVTAEWMEDHPLARAEWLRVVGLLLGLGERADSVFARVEASYLHAAEIARGNASRPSVLLGGPFRDQWFVSGGRSFMARLLADAGARYLWEEDSTAGGVPYSFESVLSRARGADVWLNPGEWRSLADGTRQDPRFSAFSAFRNGDVYNNDARLRPDGANDFWESGAVRPDRVLADLVSIFHGSEDSLYYYRRLPP